MADTNQNPSLTESSTTSSPSVIHPSATSQSFPNLSNHSIDNHPLQITHQKLNESNFREWFQSVLLVIKGKGKSGYLTSATPAPPPTATSYGT